jgi:predicted nucleotidyltransferase
MMFAVDPAVELDAVRTILRAHGVSFAFVFGSRATGSPRPDSDLDLAVWPTGELDEWALRGALPEVVDLVVLPDAPEWLAGRIALEGVVFLDDDPPARIRWQALTRKRYLDDAFRRDRFRADFVRAHG